LINEIDGIDRHEKLILIGTTNSLDKVGVSIRRSGRLDKLIKVNVPGLKQRVEILRFYLK